MGTIDSFSDRYAFLSNFYASPIDLDGEVYPTVEHAFQAAKMFDPAGRERIRTATTPASAKALGRRVALRPDWEAAKYDIMLSLVRQKFAVEPLRSQLLETGQSELIEGNHWRDRTWGCTRSPAGEWVGKNWLGTILTQVRSEMS